MMKNYAELVKGMPSATSKGLKLSVVNYSVTHEDIRALQLKKVETAVKRLSEAQTQLVTDGTSDFSSEVSALSGPSNGHTVESELCATRFKLLEEIERRKAVEDGIDVMRYQWQ